MECLYHINRIGLLPPIAFPFLPPAGRLSQRRNQRGAPLPWRLCRNQRETTSVATRNRRSGDEALERKPFIAQIWISKPIKRIPFPRRPITHNFKRPHSKAEEPDCLVRWNLPSLIIATQSLAGEGKGEGVSN